MSDDRREYACCVCGQIVHDCGPNSLVCISGDARACRERSIVVQAGQRPRGPSELRGCLNGAYQRAYDANPWNTQYHAALTRMRFTAAASKVDRATPTAASGKARGSSDIV